MRPAPRAARRKRRSGSLAANLTTARLAAGLTQTALADRLGVGVATVRRWELGVGMPRGLNARVVARFIERSAP